MESLRHQDDTRTNIPTAEYQSMVREEQESPLQKSYERRNRDLDPQLVWRGKDEQDRSDLVVNVPPLYIQEKVHPKALIADLMRQSQQGRPDYGVQADMFADFNGLPEGADRTDFYQHDGYWSNRMILDDNDPYRSLTTTLKAGTDADAWATLHSDTSRPFDKSDTGRSAVSGQPPWYPDRIPTVNAMVMLIASVTAAANNVMRAP